MIAFISRLINKAKHSVNGVDDFSAYVDSVTLLSDADKLKSINTSFKTQTIRQYSYMLRHASVETFDDTIEQVSDVWDGNALDWYTDEFLTTGVNIIDYNKELKESMKKFFVFYTSLYKTSEYILERRMMREIHQENIRLLIKFRVDI